MFRNLFRLRTYFAMKKTIVLMIALSLFFPISSSHAGWLDNVIKNVGQAAKGGEADNADSTISALKEALSVGTGNAVGMVSKANGYFANEAIKILVPEKIRTVADTLKKFGFEKQVDDFVLSMNQAAEKAAPQAESIFIDAVKDMTFDDAKAILNGGDTAATEYLKSKTFDKIYSAFKPSVAASMDQVGVTKNYKEMMGKFTAIPFVPRAESMDLDHYVTNKSLDGLFQMVGEEEKKIRTDPSARVTDLLKKVFGK